MTEPLNHSVEFTPTRDAGLERLEGFAPFAGTAYRNQRNFDYGPGDRSNVSALSPWVRHRLVTEEEICVRVMQDFALSSTEKFIQEVFWRTYWKGWLEMRPSVWATFDANRNDTLSRYDDADYQAAIEGKTSIDCFDTWAKELVETGYLHNHARMWFASIWIFTLRLDWHLGADFFLRHLMDADAASNTLSWRWVAGLQTKGKHYLARASNIGKFTDGRFIPQGLNEAAGPLPDDFAFDKPVLPAPLAPPPSGRKALLLFTEDECSAERLNLGNTEIAAIATWNLSAERSPITIGNAAANFTKGALADAAKRASKRFNISSQSFEGKNAVNDIIAAAINAETECVIAPYTPQGWARNPVDQLAAKLKTQNIAFCEIRRDWDTRAWPHATKGFFAFKDNIPKLMLAAGIDLDVKK